jgi:hypothetical protein
VPSRPAASPEPRRPRSSMRARPRSSRPCDRSRKGVPQRSPAPTSIRGAERTFPKELLPELACTSSRVRESGADEYEDSLAHTAAGGGGGGSAAPAP